jgi:uncharacterized phage-like protein YoqJ
MIKIGILGPRSFSIGGHDSNNPIRMFIKNKIRQILNSYNKQNKDVCGLTGLDIGVEQDFAEICLDLNIPYYHYVAYTNIDWSNIPNANEKYQHLSSNSHDKSIIGIGNYSPKKIKHKKRKIIDDSDIVILISSKLLPFKQSKNKKFIIININDVQTIF